MQKKMQKEFTVSYFKTLSELYQYKKKNEMFKKRNVLEKIGSRKEKRKM